MQGLISTQAIPLKRWRKTLEQVAQASQHHASFVREAVTALINFDADNTPNDLASLLELLYELHVAAGQLFADIKARNCRERTTAGGNGKTLIRKLLAL